MANFWDISETVLLENSSIKKSWVPIQFFLTGSELDRFTGKLIQSSIGEFWGVKQAVLLKNSSRPFFKVLIHYFWWMSFPVKRPFWRSRILQFNEDFILWISISFIQPFRVNEKLTELYFNFYWTSIAEIMPEDNI